MYCPRCGHQPITNELRFCSYCGFKLGVVKASLADDDAGATGRDAVSLAATAAGVDDIPSSPDGGLEGGAHSIPHGCIGRSDTAGRQSA